MTINLPLHNNQTILKQMWTKGLFEGGKLKALGWRNSILWKPPVLLGFKSPFEQCRCLWVLSVLDILVYEYPIMVSRFFSLSCTKEECRVNCHLSDSLGYIAGIPPQLFPFCEGQTEDMWRRISEITFLGWMNLQIYLPTLGTNCLQPIQQCLPTTGHLIPCTAYPQVLVCISSVSAELVTPFLLSFWLSSCIFR